jgi:hypothetical protein
VLVEQLGRLVLGHLVQVLLEQGAEGDHRLAAVGLDPLVDLSESYGCHQKDRGWVREQKKTKGERRKRGSEEDRESEHTSYPSFLPPFYSKFSVFSFFLFLLLSFTRVKTE